MTATRMQTRTSMTESKAQPGFSPWRIVVPVLCLLLLGSLWSSRYGREISIPRYCENPEQALDYLRRILTEPRPAQDDSRRAYVVAAKLLFLLPQQSDEPVARYLARLDQHLREACR